MKKLFKKIKPTKKKQVKDNNEELSAVTELKNKKVSLWWTRPFKEEDMAPVPSDWLIGGPHFVGIASPKAGTTWWNRLILEHPRVKPNRVARKELSYFCHFSYEGINATAIETYKKAFAAPEGSICGEWSPVYLNFPLAIEYLAETVPDVKLLALVRNPVDRVISAINQMLSIRFQYIDLEGFRAYIYRNFSLFPEAINYSLLYEPYKRLMQFFDRSQLLLLQYEKCKIDAGNEIARTYRFLGIDDDFLPPSLNRAINKKEYILPHLSPRERSILKKYFYDDVLAFSELFPEIDLSLWEDFKKSE